MLAPVGVGHLLAVGEVLLHRRVDDELLSDRVTCELPGELVAVPDGPVIILGLDSGEDLVVVVFQLAVVVGDDVADRGHGADVLEVPACHSERARDGSCGPQRSAQKRQHEMMGGREKGMAFSCIKALSANQDASGCHMVSPTSCKLLLSQSQPLHLHFGKG